MNEGVRTSVSWEGKYNRASIKGRLLQLSGSAEKRLDNVLNSASTSLKDVAEWAMKPMLLEDDKVEAFARELAPAIAELKLAGEALDAKAYEFNPNQEAMQTKLEEKAQEVADILLKLDN